MGSRQVAMGSYVCCAGGDSGCSQGGNITADIGQNFDSTSNSQHIQGCIVSQHGDLYITGGGQNPLNCTGT